MPSPRLCVAALMVLAVPLAGCLDQAPSLHALFTASETVPIDGDWLDKDELRLTFEAQRDGYGLEVAEKDCKGGDCAIKLDVRFGRIGGQLFADFIAHDADDEIGTWPVHAFARVRLEKDVLEFSVLDREWLRRVLREKPSSIAHEIVDGHVVLTATTPDLQKAMEKWKREPAAFGKIVPFTRRAAGARS